MDAINDERVAIRFRHLFAISRSAAHGLHALKGGEGESTRPMDLGRAVHAILFGTAKVTGYPGKVRSGKEWEAFRAANEGKEILTGKDYARAMRMAEAVSDHQLALQVLWAEGAVHEQTVEWEWMGRKCKGTPDMRNWSHVAELKTTSMGQPGRFAWQTRSYAYHAALAWYLQGVALSGNGQPDTAYVVAVESSPPHLVTVHRLTPRTLEIGRREVRLWFERLLACEAANEWPGYAQSVLDLDLPGADELVLDYGSDEGEEAAP